MKVIYDEWKLNVPTAEEVLEKHRSQFNPMELTLLFNAIKNQNQVIHYLSQEYKKATSELKTLIKQEQTELIELEERMLQDKICVVWEAISRLNRYTPIIEHLGEWGAPDE